MELDNSDVNCLRFKIHARHALHVIVSSLRPSARGPANNREDIMNTGTGSTPHPWKKLLVVAACIVSTDRVWPSCTFVGVTLASRCLHRGRGQIVSLLDPPLYLPCSCRLWGHKGLSLVVPWHLATDSYSQSRYSAVVLHARPLGVIASLIIKSASFTLTTEALGSGRSSNLASLQQYAPRESYSRT